MLSKEWFSNPPSEYRSAPFWSWNDALEEKELLRQINEMQAQGMGGFFMHPRGGMKDEYLGEKFMTIIKACVEEAERLGMKAWLYDEDRFPSGYAGGYAIKGRPELAAKFLKMTEESSDKINKNEHVLRVFRCDEEGRYTDITLTGEKLRDEEKALIFTVQSVPVSYQNGDTSYPDLCSKEAVAAFIASTHEKYRSIVGDWFGGVVPGIFTDEPTLVKGKGHTLPWTAGFEEIFQQQKGYDIISHMPALFRETPGCRKIRFDYWDLVSSLFVQNFTRQIYNWCEQNKIAFTGHFWEHMFPSPVGTGSTMPNYEYMQMPGIDMLFHPERSKDQVGNALIVKELSSVANQLGRKRTLSETYGASGWDLNFSDQKLIADWQFALGVNFVCQHLVHYSLVGFRKRDFPLSFTEQPWWECYRLLGDYIGRLSYVLSQGEYAADTLVLHSSSSTWTEYVPVGDQPRLKRIATSLKWLTRNLCELQYQYDLGDDVIMARHARVEGDRVIIGKMKYRTVILPEMVMLRQSTLKLLQEFMQNGGNVILIGPAPELLDGEESEELKCFFASSSILRVSQEKKAALQEALTRTLSKEVRVERMNGGSTGDIYVHKRYVEEEEVYFLCNFNRHDSYHLRFYLDSPERVEEWDAVTGECREVLLYQDQKGFFVELSFAPAGSHLLMVKTGQGNTSRPLPSGPKSLFVQELATLMGWKVERTDWNALPVKHCRIRLDQGPWEEEDEVPQMEGRLKERLNIEMGNVFSRQPWMYTQEDRIKLHELQACYQFHVQRKPDGRLFAAVETMDVFTVSVNGNEVSPTGQFYHYRGLNLFEITSWVNTGKNEIMLSTDRYGIENALEWIYIVGDFKVMPTENGFMIDREEENLQPGVWTENGYPYYSGKMRYKTEFELSEPVGEKIVLSLGEWWGVAARVIVNGREVTVLGWAPYETEISGFLQPGKNEIIIEVMNSLQNLMGPHHGKEPGFATPGSFYYGDGDVWFDKSGFGGNAVLLICKNSEV